jgi:hypothetical protein
MTRVFLSYAEEDSDRAAFLIDVFQKQGLEYYDWQDPRKKGSRFLDIIEDEISRFADSFVALVSEHYITSEWCRRERSLAIHRESDQKTEFIRVVKTHNVDKEKLGFLRDYDMFDLGDNPKEDIEQVQLLIDNLPKKREISFQATPIPVAVYAMTSNEAVQFIEGSKAKPNRILKMLSKHGVDGIASHYGTSRDLWRPLVGEEKTVSVLVEEMAQHENEKSSTQLIWPRFYSDDLFSGDPGRQFKAFRQFNEYGGILIVDAVSLFFDELRSTLTSCSLWGTNTAIMTLHPLGMDRFEISSSVVGKDGILRQKEFNLPFSRFFEEYDSNCDLAVSDIWHVKRWLAQMLPVTRDQMLNPRIVDERRTGVQKIAIPGKGIRDYAVGARK